MFLLLISTLGIFTLRDTRAQSVTQPDVHVTVSEGARLELRCNYSYSGTPYLFWYVQYPNQGLQLLLKSFSSGDILVKGIKDFEAEFKKRETTFHLKKSAALGSDAAKYFCAATPCRQFNHIAQRDCGGCSMQISRRRRITNFF